MNRTKVVDTVVDTVMDKVVDRDEIDPGGTMVVMMGTCKTIREEVELIPHGLLYLMSKE